MKTMWRATAEVTVVVAAILTTGVSARAQEPKSTPLAAPRPSR